ncbi:dioxygenase [Pseudomonas sp. JS425]|nr:dioxygenase [Pseudomonas sp. JS425]
MLLEAEHAGALIMVDSLKEARNEVLIRQLEALHVSEAASCQRLRRSLKRLGAVPSKKISDFHAKTMIISDMDERLMFIARGQHWVAKRIKERLPTISQRWLYEELKAVLTLHT